MSEANSQTPFLWHRGKAQSKSAGIATVKNEFESQSWPGSRCQYEPRSWVLGVAWQDKGLAG